MDSVSLKLLEYEIEYLRTPDKKPTAKEMRETIAQAIGRSLTEDRQNFTIFPALNKFITFGISVKHWRENTIKKFGTMCHHLEAFNVNLKFCDINEELLTEYLHFLSERGLTDETLKKEVKLMRWFLKWASKNGYRHNLKIDDFNPSVKGTKGQIIFLNAQELSTFRDYVIPEDGKVVELTDADGKKYKKTVALRSSLDKARDFFLFCCYTSLRYSDLQNLKETDIYAGKIHIVTVKTDDPLIIEINPLAQAILDKYAGHSRTGYALPVISEQKMNKYLKELGELCGLTAPTTKIQYRNGHRTEIVQPKWRKLTTHCGRRTFVSWAASIGIPPTTIMQWTGHADFSAMKPYLGIDDKDKSDAMALLSKAFETDHINCKDHNS